MLIVVHFAFSSLTSIKWGNNILYQKGPAQYLLDLVGPWRPNALLSHRYAVPRSLSDTSLILLFLFFSAQRRVQINRLCLSKYYLHTWSSARRTYAEFSVSYFVLFT